jgi:hypothetical protein
MQEICLSPLIISASPAHENLKLKVRLLACPVSEVLPIKKGGANMALKIEKRRYPRILVDWPVVVVTPQRYIGGETKNISLGGAFIRCVSNPGAVEPLRIVFKAPSREPFLLLTAVVVWSNQYEQMDELFSTETGIRFTSFIGDSRQFLSQAISEHARLEYDKEFPAD